jgi:hypothetical protein
MLKANSITMNTRRWILLIVIIAVLLWGGLLSRRSYRCYQKSQYLLEASTLLAQREQNFLRFKQRAESRVEQWKKELAEAKQRLASSLPDEETINDTSRLIDTVMFLIDYNTKHANDCRIKASEMAAMKHEYEELARRFRRASVRPWVSPPSEP